MDQLVIGGIVVLVALVSYLLSGPTKENETVTMIRRHHEHQAAQDRDRTRRAANLEEARRKLQAMEAERTWQRAEVERARLRAGLFERKRLRDEQAAAAERARAAEAERARQEREVQHPRLMTARVTATDNDRTRTQREAAEERARARADHQKATAEKRAAEENRRKEEDAKIALRKLEKESLELTRRLRQLEKEKEQKEAKERREKEQQEAGGGGGGGAVFGSPLRWPTRDEFQDALRRTQYDRNKFHFAIVGRAGSGKSSLINAFRNLFNRDPGAAKAGTTETTLEIGRYPDPGTEQPRQRMVWYDVPGAGTQRIPHQDYFVRQGLFVFDLVVLAIGDRFEEIDVRIIEDCARFQIPTFIVRSKADMHILNSMKEYGNVRGIEDNPALYAKCRDDFIQETQRTVSEGLQRQNLPDQEVYIVSRDVLQRTYNGTLERLRLPDQAQPIDAEAIHEWRLSKKLLAAAAGRRCEADIGEGGEEGEGEGFDGAQARAAGRSPGSPAQTSVANAFTAWVRDSTARARHHTGPPNPAASHHGNRRRRRLALPQTPTQTQTQTLAQNKTAPPAANERKPVEQRQAHAAKETPQTVLKVIYPREPTTSAELFAELVRNHPEIETILVCKPRMFTPKVGLLTFYPLAAIPREVTAFGGTLRMKDYEPRDRKGGEEKKGREEKKGGAAAAGQNRGSSLPTFGDGVPESGGSVDSSALEKNAKRGRRGEGRKG